MYDLKRIAYPQIKILPLTYTHVMPLRKKKKSVIFKQLFSNKFIVTIYVCQTIKKLKQSQTNKKVDTYMSTNSQGISSILVGVKRIRDYGY